MNALRIALGFGLIALLLWQDLLAPSLLLPLFAHPARIAIASACLIAALVIAGFRWHALLTPLYAGFSLKDAIQGTMNAAFLNSFLPGALGGDAVRAARLARSHDVGSASVVVSIAADRLLGLSALVAVTVLLLPTATLPRDSAGQSVLVAAACGTAFVLLAGATVACLPRLRPQSAHGWMAGAWRAAVVYRDTPMVLATGMLLSMLICALDVAAVALLMEPLTRTTLGMPQQALATMIGTLANSLPITPGGLGVGEAAFARACDALEPQRSGTAYATVFVAYRCIGFLAALPGAFFGPMAKERTSAALRPAPVAGRAPPCD